MLPSSQARMVVCACHAATACRAVTANIGITQQAGSKQQTQLSLYVWPQTVTYGMKNKTKCCCRLGKQWWGCSGLCLGPGWCTAVPRGPQSRATWGTWSAWACGDPAYRPSPTSRCTLCLWPGSMHDGLAWGSASGLFVSATACLVLLG